MRRRPKLAAFTLIELIVLVALVLLLAVVFVPAMTKAGKIARMKACQDNLKQVGLAFRMWSSDGGDQFVMRVPMYSGGTLEFSNQVWRTFQAMSNELGTTKILVCPCDARMPAAGFMRIANSNVSYFVNVDASEAEPQLWLSGDHWLPPAPPSNHLVEVQVNAMKRRAIGIPTDHANVLLSDGSVSGWLPKHGLGTATNAFQGWNSLRLAIPE